MHTIDFGVNPYLNSPCKTEFIIALKKQYVNIFQIKMEEENDTEILCRT